MPSAGTLFRAYKYDTDYAGFSDIVLETIEKLEFEPNEDDCQKAIVSSIEISNTLPLKVYKTIGQLQIEGKSDQYKPV